MEQIVQEIKNGARLDATNEPNGWYPLHYAVHAGHENVAALLIWSGAKIDARDLRSKTPLHLSAEFGKPIILHTQRKRS